MEAGWRGGRGLVFWLRLPRCTPGFLRLGNLGKLFGQTKKARRFVGTVVYDTHEGRRTTQQDKKTPSVHPGTSYKYGNARMPGNSDSLYDPGASVASTSKSAVKIMVGSALEDRTYPPEPEPRSFFLNRQSSASLLVPTVDRGLAVKARVSTLEDMVTVQEDRSALVQGMLDDLDVDLGKAEDRIMAALEASNQRIVNEFAELRSYYDHRFDLQNAENLRTQQHISTLKFENNQLKRKLDLTIRKLNRLQAEFDGGETAPEDELSLTGLNMTGSTDRAGTV